MESKSGFVIKYLQLFTSRSSRPDVFCKKGALGNFTKLTGKHLRQSLFFNKVAGLVAFLYPLETSENLKIFLVPAAILRVFHTVND